MEFEFLRLSVSSNSDISDDEFYYMRHGEYTRFDSFDDDIEIIKSNISLDINSVNSGQYFQYDCIDDIVIVNPETNNLANSKADETDVNKNISPKLASKYNEVKQELHVSNTIEPETYNLANSKADETNVNQITSPERSSKYDVVQKIKELQLSHATKIEKVISPLEVPNTTEPATNNLANSKADETNVKRIISPELASKYDEVVQEIKELQVSDATKIEKVISPLEVLRKRLQTRMSNKFVKRSSFLHKLKSDNYSGIFRKKSKSLSRTSDIPKIVVFSPNNPDHDTDSGNDSDSSDDVNIFKKQIDRLEKWTSQQKLHVSSKKKAMRKSI